jgi:hypothetical protein
MKKYRVVKRPDGANHWLYAIQYRGWFGWKDEHDTERRGLVVFRIYRDYLFFNPRTACQKLAELRKIEKNRLKARRRKSIGDQVIDCDC